MSKLIKEFIERKERMLVRVCWASIMRLDIIKKQKIAFDTSLAIGEDVVFNLDFANESSRIAFLNKALYFYRKNATSVMQQAKRAEEKSFNDNVYINALYQIKVAKIDSEKKKKNPEALNFGMDLSSAVMDFLLKVLKSKYNAKKH